MATMYVPGGRRSAAPVVSPRAALTSAAIADDQITNDLLSAMRGYGVSTPAPVASGSPASSVNLADIFGSGTTTADFGGGESAPAAGSPQGLGQAASQLGAASIGLSALGILGNNPGMVQTGQNLGTVAAAGTAGAQAAQGNFGQAALTLGPMAAQAMGIPGVIAGPALAAMNPTLGPVDIQAMAVTGLLGLAFPGFGILNAASGLFGGPTVKGAMTPVEDAFATAVGMTPGQSAVQSANTLATELNIDPMDALMAATDAFGTAQSTNFGNISGYGGFGDVSVDADTGIDGSAGVGIDGTTVG